MRIRATNWKKQNVKYLDLSISENLISRAIFSPVSRTKVSISSWFLCIIDHASSFSSFSRSECQQDWCLPTSAVLLFLLLLTRRARRNYSLRLQRASFSFSSRCRLSECQRYCHLLDQRASFSSSSHSGVSTKLFSSVLACFFFFFFFSLSIEGVSTKLLSSWCFLLLFLLARSVNYPVILCSFDLVHLHGILGMTVGFRWSFFFFEFLFNFMLLN